MLFGITERTGQLTAFKNLDKTISWSRIRTRLMENNQLILIWFQISVLGQICKDIENMVEW